MAADSYDAIIIGAGIVGCSIANSLAARDRSVCVVDRGPGAGYGSTSASSAIVRFNYSTWAGVAASWESRLHWEDWESHLGVHDDAGMAHFIETGGLVLDSPRQDGDRVRQLLEEVGVPYEDWDAETIAERLPWIDPTSYYPPRPVTDDTFWAPGNGTVSGCWTPKSGFVDDPLLATHNLMTAAASRGAHFRFGCQVMQILQKESGVTGIGLLDGLFLEAPIVVNAAGPHSLIVNRLAGVEADFSVGTRPMRQEVHLVRAPVGYHDQQIGPFVGDLDLGTYFRGTPAGGLLVGGTEPECDEPQWLDDPDDAESHATKEVYDAQMYRAARRIPSLGVPSTPSGVVGVYDVADDWIPIYDKTALAGYYVAIGTSGNQFKNAPVIGEMLATIIEVCESGQDHDVEPAQLLLPETHLELDLAHYSRKRQINSESSMSVMG